MISAQIIGEKKLVKAMIGGYDCKDVDVFLDEIADGVSAITKENLALKQQLKEISEKYEEFKSVEDSMRRALVSAKSIADETLEKAKKEAQELTSSAKNDRDSILQNAQEIAQQQITTYKKQIEEEQRALEYVKKKTADFISQVTAFHEKQIKEFISLSKDVPQNVSEEPEFKIDYSVENLREIQTPTETKQKEELSTTENIIQKIQKETHNVSTITELPSEEVSKTQKQSMFNIEPLTLSKESKKEIDIDLEFGDDFEF